jgi:hypothetical protein
MHFIDSFAASEKSQGNRLIFLSVKIIADDGSPVTVMYRQKMRRTIDPSSDDFHELVYSFIRGLHRHLPIDSCLYTITQLTLNSGSRVIAERGKTREDIVKHTLPCKE